jgi:hypothetical protein
VGTGIKAGWIENLGVCGGQDFILKLGGRPTRVYGPTLSTAITAAWAARPPSQAPAPAQELIRSPLLNYLRAAALRCAPCCSCCSTPLSLFSLAATWCSRCSCYSALLCCALVVLSFCSALVLCFALLPSFSSL